MAKEKTKGFALTVGIVNGKMQSRMVHNGCSMGDLSMVVASLELRKEELMKTIRSMEKRQSL